MERTSLMIDWSKSRAQGSYGWNICRLKDTYTGKRYRTCGGGFDMIGSVLGNWLADRYQDRLETIAHHAAAFNGMRRCKRTGRIVLDGGCGVESMRRIAEAAGLTLSPVPNRRGQTVAFLAEAV
jgi:hypothetical protein